MSVKLPPRTDASEPVSPSTRRQSSGRHRGIRLVAPYLLLLPAVTIVAIVLAYPIGYGAFLSFFTWQLTTGLPRVFAGLSNYLELFAGSSGFLHSIMLTALFGVISLVVETLTGLGLALLLNRVFPGRAIARTLLLLPLMIPPLVVGLVATLVWDSRLGLMSFLIQAFGGEPPVFLGQAAWALPTVALTEAWRSTPFIALVVLAALQAVPRELKEAAEVDGAGKWAVFRHVVVPIILPVAMIALLFRTVDLIRTFGLVYAMTGGGPGASTEVAGLWIYRVGFQTFDIGLSSAGSIILFILALAVSIGYIRVILRRQSASG